MADQGGAGTAPAPAAGGLQDNVAALLAYLFGVVAIIFLVIEPYNKNKFVRFHCFQCLFFWGAIIAGNIVLTIASIVLGMIPVVGGIVALLLWLGLWGGSFVAWVMLMIKAYQGQKWKLPFIGELAEKQANS